MLDLLRFTPPTHTILAFRQALKEFHEEGGLAGREKRYKDNRSVLKKGMAEMGFAELVPEQYAGHIITCFYYPKHSNFSFEKFYQKLSDIGVFLWSLFCYYIIVFILFRPSHLSWKSDRGPLLQDWKYWSCFHQGHGALTLLHQDCAGRNADSSPSCLINGQSFLSCSLNENYFETNFCTFSFQQYLKSNGMIHFLSVELYWKWCNTISVMYKNI